MGKQCGDDGCGGSCGECAGVQDECQDGVCICVPDCDDKWCGGDGCTGNCGKCVGPQEECQFGKCICVPDCEGKTCGNDGCGGLCNNLECLDTDGDGVPDDEDQFPNDPDEWADTDGDLIGNNADDDDDNDGLLDEEEIDFGTDCTITDPLNPDTDQDGAIDSADAYPKDPFPAFFIMRRDDGHMYVFLTDGQGGFQAPITIGQDLGWVCAEDKDNCNPPCGGAMHCEVGQCVADNAAACPDVCDQGFVCRGQQYRYFAIADFDGDGGMDFVAHSYPKKQSGTYSFWFFYRLDQSGSFPQVYVGEVEEPIVGVLSDVNGDYRFDFVKYWKDQPGYIDSGGGYSFLGGGPLVNAPCVIGDDPVEGCTFTKVDPAFDITPQIKGKWGNPYAKQAQDLNGDDLLDLVFGVYASGGASNSDVFLMHGNGNGTFGQAIKMFTHAGAKGPANAYLFADFNSDEIGDVLLGLDDDGDAGAAWLYPGTGAGSFSLNDAKKVFDLNPGCNSGCSDKYGVTGAANPFDFDFDGNLDIIVGYKYCEGNPNCNVHTPTADDSKLLIFFGVGDGTFQDAELIYQSIGTTEAATYAVPIRICPWYVF